MSVQASTEYMASMMSVSRFTDMKNIFVLSSNLVLYWYSTFPLSIFVCWLLIIN